MKLHCDVEVTPRHLPALGLRNRGKGVRAVLSLCQQTPRSQPRPRAGGEPGGPPRACLLISTLKDKRGTRYEVRRAGVLQGSRGGRASGLAPRCARGCSRPRGS
ncbi:Leucine-rich repeat protein 1 [Tupaia chinensis]|uniref:Leucine-rich repeat protein 1 n=1 Tax=Tupaia chinensis TaxID=246437 RepID=L9JDH6_TUPCH|nr:Leucine-rich repeat protein 1 [Tupaia chinensis]